MNFVDEIESDLASLISSDFDGTLSGKTMLRDTLYAWLHYRARLIPQRPREVLISTEVQSYLQTHRAIGEVAAQLRVGGDVSPWLSERVRLRKSDFKADLMFNDWQISHFHLGNVFDRATRVKRSSLLLFAYINGDRAVLLDVQPHRSFSMQNLIRILLRTSPQDMNTELIGILPGKVLTDDDIYNIRSKGGNAPIILDGKTYMSPGIGIAGAGNAIRITRFGDLLMEMWRDTRTRLENNRLPTNQMSRIVESIGMPVRIGLVYQQGLFVIYEKNRQLAIMQTRPLE